MKIEAKLVRGNVYMIQHEGQTLRFDANVWKEVSPELREILKRDAVDMRTIPASNTGEAPENIPRDKFTFRETEIKSEVDLEEEEDLSAPAAAPRNRRGRR